ncbi:FAD-dependent oxidoreductase [Ramlibacter albus]|uniref:FAD-dependent oxidoreductase n=1 Tax=Ramlibacter albus TaxID=2079448 RepID=A0A923M6P4_9BURK|nr:FAD-dependent oxidoreductase [Ramlibacter albus]MBC5763709.1 FAD-dependent oxidoreductase [Ramlibacter albus]
MGQGPSLIRRRTLLAATAAALAGCEDASRVTGGFAGANADLGHMLRDKREWAAPRTSRRTQVVVAGAGVAGLAAARALRMRGIEDFVVLDAESQAGGNSRAGEVKGIACPLGAHYLPVPGDEAREVQALLEELGLRRRVAGRWTYDERHLCHSPQERLYHDGEWRDGLLPVHGAGPGALMQYRKFAQLVERLSQEARFTIPLVRGRPSAVHASLDAVTFAAWLDAQGFNDPLLRWYLDYCCRDDYGAGIATVSAWAGIHYFAARHGFHAPGTAEGEPDAPLTWGEGNGWLTRALARPLGDRFRGGQLVARVAAQTHGVEVDVYDARTQSVERWQAAHCVVALPVFVAARVVENAPAFLRAHAAATGYAPWVVANLHLDAPLADRGGAPPAWDNVVHGGTSLGYVDATHQALNPVRGATVLSWYHAPGEAARADVLRQPWTAWRDAALAELTPIHPDLPRKLTHVEVARYGHAMAIPTPGSFARAGAPPRTARLSFAHADYSGYSVFEEAFTLGHLAGTAA